MAAQVVLPGTVLQLSPTPWFLQAGPGLLGSEPFCRGDSESQLWQKATSRPCLLGRNAARGGGGFQKLGQGVI